MEEKTKTEKDHRSLAWKEILQKTKADPERAKRLEAMERVMRENRKVLQLLADS
jgi:hypothetical protein